MDRMLVKLSQPRQLLSTLLAEPELFSIVRGIDAPTLGRLIHHVGLEDAGELLALATTEQLSAVFDEDLWKADAPGENEGFDAQRFATWLEVMLEAGANFTARRLLELDEDLVMLALSQHARAIDSDRVAAAAWKGVAPLDRGRVLQQALDSSLYHEFEEYLVYSTHEPSWSSWLAVMLELDRVNPDRLNSWLERLAHITFDERDLDDEGEFEDEDDTRVLRRSETLADDVAAERHERREREGYVTASDAHSFLRLARSSSLVEILGSKGADAITDAYFRQWFAGPAPAKPAAGELSDVRDEAPAQAAAAAAKDVGAEASPAVAQWIAALQQVDNHPGTSPRMLGAGAPVAELLVRAALAALRHEDPALHERRVFELSYLANVLLAGVSHAGRSLRPVEAAEAAVALCNVGLERALGPAARAPGAAQRAATWLQRHDLVMAFRVGVHVAHHDLALAASRVLGSRLRRGAQRAGDSAKGRLFAKLASELEADAAQDAPWRSAERLSALEGILVPATLATFVGLLDACPVLPPAMPETLVRQSATTGRFVATDRQVAVIATALLCFGVGFKPGCDTRPDSMPAW